VQKYRASSIRMATKGVTCGRPSTRSVDNKYLGVLEEVPGMRPWCRARGFIAELRIQSCCRRPLVTALAGPAGRVIARAPCKQLSNTSPEVERLFKLLGEFDRVSQDHERVYRRPSADRWSYPRFEEIRQKELRAE
jgi:hypothetical protein